MDRNDERKHDRMQDEDTERPARSGDVLGLGGADVPKTPGDPSTEYDEESVARRRERASGVDESGVEEHTNTMRRGKGATGIDMGSSGTGTDVSGE
jgi:hypothetical protein